MAETTKITYAFSTDEEDYEGDFESIEEAIAEAMHGEEATVFWVGKCEAPTPPEQFWNAEDWLDHVSCQDEYCHDFAADWDDSTKSQREELEAAVRAVMAEWLDRHDLRPRFYTVVDPVKYVVVDGKAVKAVNP